MKKPTFIILLLVFFFTKLSAQDTLKLMHLNTMYYGVEHASAYHNDLSVKNPAFKTIFQYTQPDILSLNEISPNPIVHDSLLNNTLNVGGITHYKKAIPTTNNAGSDIINVVFYNSQKVALYSGEAVQTYYRDINIYKFYCLNENLKKGDTIFFACVVAHLKSSNTNADRRTRNTMVTNALNYLNKKADNINYFFMGDFNVYTATEPAFVTLTTYPNKNLKFYDPVSRTGKWQDNPDFSIWHTQSSRGSVGGLDDRFDFIMINRFVKDGSKNIKYIPNTYQAIGNDGQHLNKALNNPPTNTLYPMEIANALVVGCDHLPVSLLVEVTPKTEDKVHTKEKTSLEAVGEAKQKFIKE